MIGAKAENNTKSKAKGRKENLLLQAIALTSDEDIEGSEPTIRHLSCERLALCSILPCRIFAQLH